MRLEPLLLEDGKQDTNHRLSKRCRKTFFLYSEWDPDLLWLCRSQAFGGWNGRGHLTLTDNRLDSVGFEPQSGRDG